MDSKLKARTRSLQLVLDPITKQVEHLERLTEGRTGDSRLPNLVTAAAAARDAVYSLNKIVNSEVAKSQDEQLKTELSTACAEALMSSEQLVETAKNLRQQPSSRHVRVLFLRALERIKKGVIQVFICWDDAALRRIVTAAQLSLDKLEIMSGSRSMRSLVLCFRGYADAMKVLLALIDTRQKELIDADRKRKLFASLSKLKALLPQFSSAMQQYVKLQTLNSKETKDDVCKRISGALRGLMQSVDEQGAHGLESMATNIAHVQHKLGTDRRYVIGPDLDRHIDAVIQNSKAVACVSSDEYKEMILNECGEVLSLRRELGTHFEAVAADPTSVRAKRAFDRCAERLCEKLNELDCFVNDSVVDQVADVFVETAAPINHLVQTATGQTQQYSLSPTTHIPLPPPPPPPTFHTHTGLDPGQSVAMRQRRRTSDKQSQTPPSATPLFPTSHEDEGLTKQVELFRRHSRRLSQVAAYTAQRTTDTERIRQIEELAGTIDKLTSAVAEKAMEVSNNPGRRRAREELDSLRKKWAENVQNLKKVIDEIIDPEDFIALSESNIQQDMAKCQGAIRHGNWAALRELVVKIAAKARRAQEVGENAVAKATDHTYKAALSTAVARLEKAIPKVVSTANKLIENPSSSEQHTLFISSLRELLECLHDIQSVLGTEIEFASDVDEDEDLLPKKTSTPMHSSDPRKGQTAHKRRMRRNVFRSQDKRTPPHVPDPTVTRKTAEQREQLPIKKGVSIDVGFDGGEDELDSGGGGGTRRDGDGRGVRLELSLSSHSRSSGTQTPRSPTKDQASQVDDVNLNFSVNATYGSTKRAISPSSSTSSWTLPTSSEHTPRSFVSRDHIPISPVRQDPPSPSGNPPPLYSSPSPSPPPSPPPLHSSEEDMLQEQEEDAPQTPAEVAVQAYVSPLQKLVSAAERGDPEELSAHCSSLSARAIRLAGIAESAASALGEDAELVKVIQTKSQEVSMLTPKLLKQARVASRSKQDQNSQPWEDFRTTTHTWAGHVRDLIDATQQANLPWSHTAEQLVKAAETGNHLEAEMEHIGTQTRRMVDIATMTLEAAETEEAIGDADHLELGRDPELQEQVKTVRTKMSEIQKLTPQLLGAAEMALSQPMGSASSEHLHLVSQEWATKAKVLMKGVDDITLGMGGAADTLILSAQSGDAGLLSEQTKSIKMLASSLETMARDAMEGCGDEEKVKVVKVVAKKIDKLSARLVDCASIMSQTFQVEDGEEPSLAIKEDVELLRREWSSQVHLLTAHIDHLTAETSAPLDRLMELSLQANRTSGLAKQHLLNKFETKSTSLLEQLENVQRLFEEIMKKSDLGRPPEVAVSSSRAAIVFLRNLTPRAVGAARYLATDAGSAMLEHFTHLHRQWATKAQFLLASLNKIEMADVGQVTEAFHNLLHDSGMTSPQLVMVEVSDVSDQSSQSSKVDLSSSSLHRSYSTELITPCTRFDFDESELHAPSTPSVELRPKKKKAYIPSLSEMGLRHVQPRAKRRSMTLPLPSWASGENNDDIASFDSITEAARLLRELTDEFMEENPMVSVGKKMSEQMTQMAEFSRGKGDLQNKVDMINTAKAVAVNGQNIAKIAHLISKRCKDQRTRSNLQCCAEMIPTLSTQLTMLASVKISTPDDVSADMMLVKNAQNLMQAVIKTVQAAEAACMKGLKPLTDESFQDAEDGEQDTLTLAMNWKRKLYHQRAKETISAPRGARGLRKLNKYRMSTPSVVDVIKPSELNMKSPTNQ